MIWLHSRPFVQPMVYPTIVWMFLWSTVSITFPTFHNTYKLPQQSPHLSPTVTVSYQHFHPALFINSERKRWNVLDLKVQDPDKDVYPFSRKNFRGRIPAPSGHPLMALVVACPAEKCPVDFHGTTRGLQTSFDVVMWFPNSPKLDDKIATGELESLLVLFGSKS